MNSVLNFPRALQAAAVVAIALVFSSPTQPVQAHGMGANAGAGMGANMARQSEMMALHGQMMAEHARMIAEMKAADATINDLVSKLKTAPQTQKVDLLTDIVTRLAAQQTALHDGMDKMHQMMGAGGMCPCMMNGTGETTPEQPVQQR